MLDLDLKNAKILIVDDQEANIDVLVGFLQNIGFYDIKAITDPRSTVSLFKSFNPDIILLDLLMPQLSGFKVMEKLIPLIPVASFMPILVLTADVSAESKQLALSSGAKDFLTKPFDFVEMGIRINNLLETRYLYQQVEKRNLILEEKISQFLKLMDEWHSKKP